MNEARQAQDALRETEERFRQMAENIEETFWVADAGLTRLMYVTKAYERIWGRSRQSLYDNPLSFLDAVFPEDRPRVEAGVEKMLQNGGLDSEYRIVRPDGSVRWIWDRAFAVRDSAGAIQQFVGIVQDITARKEAERELKSRAAQQRALAELNLRALEGGDIDSLMNETVRQLAEVLEVEFTKVLELRLDKSLLLRAGVGWKEGCVGHATVGTEKSSQAGYTLLCNAPVIVEDLPNEKRFTGPPLLHEHGVVSGISTVIGESSQPLGVLGVHSGKRRKFTEDDVHFVQSVAAMLAATMERRRAEEALRFSEARFRSMFVQAAAGLAIVSPEGRFLQANPALCDLLGYSEAEMLALSTFDITHPEDLGETRHFFEEVLAGRRRTVDVEKRFLRKDGGVIWARVSGAWVVDAESNPLHAIVLVQDITARRRVEEALRESEERYRRIVETAYEGIWMADENDVTTFVNREMARMLGCEVEEMIGRPMMDFMRDQESRELASAMLARRRQGVREHLDFRFRLDEDTELWTYIRTTPLYDTEGRYTGGLAMLTDITERKRAEESIRRLNEDLEILVAERTTQLAAVNQELALRNQEVERASRLKSEFLARMSHELRTPMNAIVGFSDLLAEETEGPLNETQQRFLQHIREGARHLLDLINDVLDLSKIEAGRIELRYEEFDVGEALTEVLSVIQPLAEAKKLVVGSEVHNALAVWADRTRFKQILYNLLSNSVKFTPEGGRVLVEAWTDEDCISVSVIDTGVGIPAEEHEAIFGEFHQVGTTTKGVKEGTGLGLAITRRLVELHRGRIRVESEPDKGSRFTFCLPVSTPHGRVSRAQRAGG
ncbi:MAG: PAS domain S-box protein, partial [Acidobacteria bacterium]|nr:PAS domain S-box protein [Acidobacteriota bacterium]